MNYELEMNYIEKSIIRRVAAFNTCIGPNNTEEFGWVANNIDDFRRQSIKTYQKLLAALLTQKEMRLYIYETYSKHVSALFQEISISNVDLSFLDQCNNFIAILSEHEPLSSHFYENQNMFFEDMYEKGYLLFEIKDFFTEGNSMTFYCRNCEVFSQLEEIARTIGFAKVV